MNTDIYPKGHLLSVQFPLYHHVGISDGKGKVYENSRARDGRGLVTLADFSSEKEIIDHGFLPGSLAADEIIENAKNLIADPKNYHLLKNNWLTGPLYWASSAQKEELAHRRYCEEIIDFLEISHIRKSVAGTLSYGLRKRVELARAMALKPELILLDEPMAGMNLEEKEDMARYILDLNEEFGITVVMIEHDMGVVMDISHKVMVLDFGKKLMAGLPDEVMADPHVKRAYLGIEDDEVDDIYEEQEAS